MSYPRSDPGRSLTRVGTLVRASAYHRAMPADESFEVSAALLRRGNDIASMVSQLSERLQRALPDHVEVSRSRLRRRATLAVDLGVERYRLELEGQRAHAWVDHIVREVCVRSDELDVDAWLERLASALEREAQASTTLRLALEEALS